MQVDSPEKKGKIPVVLLVDDEENILTSLRRLFRPLGYQILVATGGEAALDILTTTYVDLVVSDMRMPNMDGAQFLEQVAKRWPGTIRILLTGYADLTSTISAVNKGNIYRYISKPWEDNDLKISVQRALEQKFLEDERLRLEELTRLQNEELKQLNAHLEERVKERTAELSQTMHMLEKAHDSLKKQYSASIKVFASLIEMREGTVAGHSRRVADMARKLAQAMKVSEEEIQSILFAGLLHDIGKIGLPDSLLAKPFNALPGPDRIKVAKHPIIGQAVLMALEPLHEAASLIRSHHERFDGRGFPDGIGGDKIPLGARILAVVNDYDSLQIGAISTQRYASYEARQFIFENRGKRYDPVVVDAFMELLGEGDGHSTSEQDLYIKSGSLKSGMALSRDLITPDGILLLSKEYILDDKLIQKIQTVEVALSCDLEIYVHPRKLQREE